MAGMEETDTASLENNLALYNMSFKCLIFDKIIFLI